MKSKKWICLLIVALGIVSQTRSDAQLVYFTYTGTINNIDHYDGNTRSSGSAGVFDSSVAIGTRYSVTFNLDMSAPDNDSQFPTAGYYYGNGAMAHLGNYDFSPAPAVLNNLVLNDSPLHLLYLTDGYQGQSILENYDRYEAGGSLQDVFTEVFLRDATGTALTSKTVYPTGPGTTDISRWDYRQFNLTAYNPNVALESTVYGTVDSISITSTPEPGALGMGAALLLSGFLFVCSRHIYKKSPQSRGWN